MFLWTSFIAFSCFRNFEVRWIFFFLRIFPCHSWINFQVATSGERPDNIISCLFCRTLWITFSLRIIFIRLHVSQSNFSGHFQARHVSIYELTILQPMRAYCVCYLLYLVGCEIEAGWSETSVDSDLFFARVFHVPWNMKIDSLFSRSRGQT